jgi:cyclase
MRRIRVIPCLLVQNGGLVKTIKFDKPTYVGDPINAIKIFNEKEVDELIVVDITATAEKRKPNLSYIQKLASECFMPLCYGGGVQSIEDIKALMFAGVEKVAINSYAFENHKFIEQAALSFGSSTIVISIDVKKDFFGRYRVFTKNGTFNTKLHPTDYAKQMADLGAGEIFLNSIDKDGLLSGYDIELIEQVASKISIPLISCGGAHKVEDFTKAVQIGHASAVAAGSMFVFHGKHRAVLINFPEQKELKEKLFSAV